MKRVWRWLRQQRAKRRRAAWLVKRGWPEAEARRIAADAERIARRAARFNEDARRAIEDSQRLYGSAEKAARRMLAAPVSLATFYGGPMDGQEVPFGAMGMARIVTVRDGLAHEYVRGNGRFEYTGTGREV